MTIEDQQVVQPRPVPASVSVGVADMPNGDKLVFHQIMTPTGSFVYFLPPDIAETVGKQLMQHARDARIPGLTIAHSLPNGPSSPLKGPH